MRQRTMRSASTAQVADMANLSAAWQAVRRKHGSEGLDGVSIRDFQAAVETHLCQIQQALCTYTYQPSALKRVTLHKPDHRQRLIGVPTVADRIVQHAILNVLEPHFEPCFCPCSYGFRPGRSAHQAVQAVADGLQEGLSWVVEADLQDFFDTLDWTILRQQLVTVVHDPPLLTLIQHFLQAGALRGHNAPLVEQGTPQGAVLSPLFSNVYLTPFDRLMLARGYRLIRYADDFLTLHRTRDAAVTALQCTRDTLEGQLHLRLHGEKTRITDAHRQPVDFLSFRFHKGTVLPTPQAVERFQNRVQAMITAQQAQGGTAVATQLNPLIRGWGEYFKIGQVAPLYQQLDAWLAAQLDVPPGPGSGVASLVALYARYQTRHQEKPL